MTWTPERIQQLGDLWGAGLSASEIARTMGGVTRSAVIGKVHRLGLSGRTATKRQYKARPKTAPISIESTPHSPEPDFQDLITTGPEALPSEALRCRYPMDSGKACTNMKTHESYCDHHHAICYTGTQYTRPKIGWR